LPAWHINTWGVWLGCPQVWNLTNCKLRHNLVGHHGYINTVTVSPDGSLCASGGKVCHAPFSLLWVAHCPDIYCGCLEFGAAVPFAFNESRASLSQSWYVSGDIGAVAGSLFP
jgi:hypothetical protein